MPFAFLSDEKEVLCHPSAGTSAVQTQQQPPQGIPGSLADWHLTGFEV